MKRKIRSISWLGFWIIYLELIYRIFVLNSFLNVNTLCMILFSIPWIIILGLLLNIFKEKINRILNILFSGAIAIIYLAQIVYFNFYNSMFSFFSLTTGTGQVMQFWQIILEVILRISHVFLLVLVPYFIYIIFNKKLFNYKRLTLKWIFASVIILFFSLLVITLEIKNDNDGIYSTKGLLCSIHAPMLTIEKTGLLTMEAIDLYRYIFGFEEEVVEDTEEVTFVIEDPVGYNALDIDFENLINKTKDNDVKNMHKYFGSVEPTLKNKYTGLFEGKNIIFISAEAFDTIAIDKDITPTLYKMANNSFVFNNYYQPLYPVSTSDGEYMNLTSLIPKEGVWSFYKSSSIEMPFGFGTMFKNKGYISYAFHNHNYNYYERGKSHPNLGFKYLGCGNGLEKKMECDYWPNSDYEMMEATLDYYLDKDKPFATYYMTVSGHLNYNFYGNHMAMRNKKAVSNLKYSDAVKAYYATQIELDKALELLLKTLEEKELLDDTLIVLAPDHYPYGLTIKQMNEVSKINRNDKFENYHTSLIMYNPSIEKTEINDVVSSLDILPTIYNLFGMEYDSRLLMGRDIFSEEESIVILSDRSWITNKGKYNSVNKKFTKTTDEEVSQEYIDEINKIVYKRFTMSSLILDNDYYSKLGL